MSMITDYAGHNEEVRKVWEAYGVGKPTRVPMILGISAQSTLMNLAANPQGFTYRRYMEDPEAMLGHQLARAYWIRHEPPQDAEMGMPERWSLYPDGQNIYEAGWFGAHVVIAEDGPPYAETALSEETKWEVIERGIPDPLGGYWAQWSLDRYEYFRKRIDEGLEFHGKPVVADPPCGLGTDGPFTVAYQIRGATELCTDIYADPEYFHALMNLVTEGAITRIKAMRRFVGQPEESRSWGFADDAILMLSIPTYREHVLPYHKRLCDEFGADGPNGIHLCGDTTHLFRTIRDELKVNSFDTGFPVDFGWLRGELGPEVTINGGPSTSLLRYGTPAEVDAEVRRILGTGVCEGGKFILREGNNVAPRTPLENLEAMYRACLAYGAY
jgi:uroporphyrinogen-III decarboxylase